MKTGYKINNEEVSKGVFDAFIKLGKELTDQKRKAEKSKGKLWVVEFYDGKKWTESMYVSLNKEDALLELEEAREFCEDECEDFRVVKYKKA